MLVLSLSEIVSPTCAPAIPVLSSLLSSDLALSSFLFLFPFYIAIVRIAVLFGGILQQHESYHFSTLFG